jgi:hypothetical protein
MNHLPGHILAIIFQHVPFQSDKIECMLVSRHWKEVMESFVLYYTTVLYSPERLTSLGLNVGIVLPNYDWERVGWKDLMEETCFHIQRCYIAKRFFGIEIRRCYIVIRRKRRNPDRYFSQIR